MAGDEERKGERTRRRLLEVAALELIEGGGDLDVARVAVRAGVSAGLPYRYFPTKSDLLAALVHAFFDRFDAEVFDREFEGATWTARERARTLAFVEFFLGDPLAPRIGKLAADPRVAVDQRARVDRQMRAAARNVRAGQKLGEVDADLDPEVTAAVVIGGMTQTIEAALHGQLRTSRKKLPGHIWRTIANLMRLDPSG